MKLATMLILLLAIASTGWSAEWHVAKDGTGDFTVIQDAVDAASPGDVIYVHAGRYTEMTEDHDVYGNGVLYADVHVAITKDDLTIIGDGYDATIIGPESFPSPPPTGDYFGMSVAALAASTFTMRDIAFESTKCGFYSQSPVVRVDQCRFTGNLGSGIVIHDSLDATIADCRFEGGGDGVTGRIGSRDILVSDCSFMDVTVGLNIIGSQDVTIDSCSIENAVVGVEYEQGATGELRDTIISSNENVGVNSISGSSLIIQGVDIEGGGTGARVGEGGFMTLDECSIINHSFASVYVTYYGSINISNSTILNGGGWSVLCLAATTTDCHLDMTNNYWGTDSADQIAEWISDSVDDPERCCTVDYIPFNGPVASEPRSWSAVKGLFGDEEVE